ncbi:hypothetical protein SS50377_26372 [Spironucleus salmonicida]|uniref:SCP domain-containing protein n=1 Tax=Spironucleus salmonicida TaxID=348837 RepID=V6LVN7_9EUKA|nr:hypothetical protein SS50377_26372 [Spironucleus salmonicida]|eukprot:EST47761.1 hypothetical protein SS50377_12160 [Spironucleus salmonicida]
MLILLLQSIKDNLPTEYDHTKAPVLLDFQPIFNIKYDDISNYTVYQLVFNIPIVGGLPEEFLAHPSRGVPIKIDTVGNLIRLSFKNGTDVHQIQYFGSSIKSKLNSLPSPAFNVLIYYRLDNANQVAWEKESVRLTIEYRATNGLQPWLASKKLNQMSRLKAIDMAANDYESKESPIYGDLSALTGAFATPVSRIDMLWVINDAQFTPQEAFDYWIDYYVFKSIMLSTAWYTSVGAGYVVQTPMGAHWVQIIQGYDCGLEDSFYYGQDLVLHPPYNVSGDKDDPALKTGLSVAAIVGLIASIVIVSIGAGCIIGFVIVRRKNTISQ